MNRQLDGLTGRCPHRVPFGGLALVSRSRSALGGKVHLFLPGKSTVKFSLPETSSHSKQDFFNP
jgi:hypothetical protein